MFLRVHHGIFSITISSFLLAPAAFANLVQNGNFDANNPSSGTAPLDWTLTNASSGSDFFVGSGPAFGALSAPNSANFGAVGAYDDTLSQTLTTDPGATYILTFYLAHDSSNSANDFSAVWNGATVLSLVNSGYFDYTEYTYNVTATGTSTVLAFSGREVPAWYDLDNVSVTATPEPGLLGVSGIGLALLYAAVAMQRRRNAASDSR